MNRKQFYLLRHNIRASGWEWNWGSKLTKPIDPPSKYMPQKSMLTGEAKTPKIRLVASTLHTSYDEAKKMEYVKTDSMLYMPLYREWEQVKRRGLERTHISWQNYIRSNVRNDRRLFSHQLTSY